MVVRPLELIVSEMIRDIQAVLPSANVLPGSVIRETLVNPPAAQLSFITSALETIRQAQTIAEATGSDLDRLASNFGLTRDAGRAAIGELVLVLSNTVASATITVSDGSMISTDERVGSTEFMTIGTYTFRPIDKEFYAAEAVRLQNQLKLANINNAQYAAIVPIQALNAGSIGNVGAYTIFRGNIPGVSSVINLTPTVGGIDVESDSSLRRRITLVLSGSSTGTKEGLVAVALANPTVTDAFVIGPGNVLMTRDGSIYDADGNLVKEGTGRSVDLYIKGEQTISNTETFT